jgi:hypothetical protein
MSLVGEIFLIKKKQNKIEQTSKKSNSENEIVFLRINNKLIIINQANKNNAKDSTRHQETGRSRTNSLQRIFLLCVHPRRCHSWTQNRRLGQFYQPTATHVTSASHKQSIMISL